MMWGEGGGVRGEGEEGEGEGGGYVHAHCNCAWILVPFLVTSNLEINLSAKLVNMHVWCVGCVSSHRFCGDRQSGNLL